MQILIVSATHKEVQPLREHTFSNETTEKKHLHFLNTGIGMTQTAYALTKALHTKYDLVINTGIAGSFYRGIVIGEVVQVVSENLVEMGAENGEEFLPFEKLDLPGKTAFSNSSHIQTPALDELKKVMGATVNKVHGNEVNISNLLKQYDVEVETMEGAAVALVCEQEQIPYIQIRSISNYVTKRDKDAWDIPLAIKNLNETLIKIINEI